MFMLGNERTLVVLKDLLIRLLETGYRSKDKELRNAVLIVMSFLSRWAGIGLGGGWVA
jgi:hypothetical protein